MAANEWSPESLPLEQCVKLACIAELFGQLEFAFELLSWIAGSPQAGRTGSLCGEIVNRGLETYRAISQMKLPGPAGSLEAENKRLAAELAAQFRHAERLEAGLADWSSAARRLQAERDAHASQVERLEAGLEVWMKEAMRLRVELAAQSKEATDLRPEHAAEVSHVTRIEAERPAQASETTGLRADLAVQVSVATQVAAELATCKGEIARLRRERQDLYASTSWRLTALIRHTKTLVSGTLKKLGWRQ